MLPNTFLLCQTRVPNFDSEDCLEESLTPFSIRRMSSSLSSYRLVDEFLVLFFILLFFNVSIALNSLSRPPSKLIRWRPRRRRRRQRRRWATTATMRLSRECAMQTEPRNSCAATRTRERKREVGEPPSLFHSTREKQHLITSQSNFRTNKDISMIHTSAQNMV